MTENDQRYSPPSLGGKPAARRSQCDMRHHPLTEQAQQKYRNDQYQHRVGESRHQCRHRQCRHYEGDHPVRGKGIYEPSEKRQTQGAGQCSEHVEPAELAVTEIKRRLPFGDRC